MELGYSAMTRRERLERIAMAERDRRAGRIDVAVAALGEASEWPARVVLALARMPAQEAPASRQILEEGLDLWASEVGLEPIETPNASSDLDAETELERPIDNGELERAFAEAEAQTDEMHGANDVAERVLMDEPMGLLEIGEESFGPIEESNDVGMRVEADSEMDATRVEVTPVEGAWIQSASENDRLSSQAQMVAVLEQWLQNLEGIKAGRVQ